MRLHLTISPIKKEIQFNYQPILTGALHKWIGENEEHGSLSLYSFSWLQGGSASTKGISFSHGTRFFVSAHDSSLLKKIISGIQEDPLIKAGFAVEEVMIEEDRVFGKEEVFHVASPVFVKRKIEDREVHFTYTEENSNHYLTETLKRKLRKAGLSDAGVHVSFDKDYGGAKTKIIHYKQIKNKVSICPVKVIGSPEQIVFAWNVGVGNSTGIGFGSLK